MEYFGGFEELFADFVLISLRSYAGILNNYLQFVEAKQMLQKSVLLDRVFTVLYDRSTVVYIGN
jgi:hypothetical protein